jgi:hypothetical protein
MTNYLISENGQGFNPYLSVTYTDGELLAKYELVNKRIEKIILDYPLYEGIELIKLENEFIKLIEDTQKLTSALRANGYSKQVYNF